MKLQILQENLEKAVNTTSRFASSRAQLPVLGNILISTRKSKIHVSSTNLEISASVQVGAKIEEEGEISVPAKIISELVANLPKETVDMVSEKEQLKVSVSGFSSTILGMNSSDFPKIPNSVDKEKSIGFQQNELVKALGQVLFATSTDETRPILTGVLFLFGKNSISLVATDGFRLSRKTLSFKMAKKVSNSVVIPKGVLGEISRTPSEEAEIYFGVQEKEKQVIFGIGDTVLTSRLLEGEYPDFEKIIPKASSIKVFLDKEEFTRAVKLASIFARESANIVRIKVLKDSINVSAESSAAGSQETKVDARVESTEKNFEIAFNYRFVEEFLHSASGEEIKVEFTSITAPGVFTDTSDSSYLHLVMPVKV
ncbi:MAG: polymerase III subunit beta protein [Microgenomates group bacterium GW2011_GWC1_43_13]|uniref:Beta sliding clamp n=3 Tax=Candidatus Woeseibacteriota TaxID=1752722 RepID=A0A837IC61_9BACT|nr:MAG: polymerase III subunit beta protein [Microgenomates group bacterium GW2011_GWC1_43_13]KKT32835.1 MAG: polymerase III subunit beta protein [Candidatus Woesebacteria bacterium GW2011_GWB1_44_11]KKT54632.1 MAG: polymerase III subunit beta protein [Candidatus Woesebacteria bacterium GW2011_GWA1_44_23]OGM75762.1 MAG: DNA polymerase III subunit beta [Candidatus Woesebacteria bacterium RIFOXYA1_FULL_43_16]OGM81616.1 MAG: DNA polymerase III subunit beta [Candidatus Woesebacteria bacterium RIFOX